jgi:DNA-binding FrmR family transcriptional regulator
MGRAMQHQPDATSDVITRLRRAEGQIRGVIAMLEAERDCGEVVVQLAAVSRALDRAGFRLLASQLQQCLTASPSGQQQDLDLERLEKLFLSLA